MTDNIKTGLLAIIALALFGHTMYKITSNGTSEKASAPGSSIISLNNSTPADNATPILEPVNPDESKPKLPPTTIIFQETVFDFGTITDGDKVSHTFEFTNSGTNPLVISNARGSCGCTVPVWPKEPIAPGETGEIQVEYNSTNKNGQIQQTVTIDANTEPGQSKLTIKVNVLKKEGADDNG